MWAADNNLHFLEPLLERLSASCEIVVFEDPGDTAVLHQEMSAVDVCWFEWGNGPVVPATHGGPARPIICRIHRYELYGEYLRRINWGAVNVAIFSSPSMLVRFQQEFRQEAALVDARWIPCGIDQHQFPLGPGSGGTRMLSVGRLHPHKDPGLLLQVTAAAFQEDPRLQLRVIGARPDPLYDQFLHDQLDKLRARDRVALLGSVSQAELVQEYQWADYILVTSVVEGLSQASLEAMACGATPVVRNYWGAELHYRRDRLFNTVDEAVQLLLQAPLDRADNRSQVEDRFALASAAASVEALIDRVRVGGRRSLGPTR